LLKKLTIFAAGLGVLASVFLLSYSTSNHTGPAPLLVVVLPVLLAYLLYVLFSWLFFRSRASRDATSRIPHTAAGIPPAAGTARETDWLLLLRGLAALLVFIMHTGIVFSRDYSWGGNPWAWLGFSPAWLGMILFFSLSGYLMGKGFFVGKYSPNGPGAVRFLKNRFLRIVPLTLAVAFMILIWQAPTWFDNSDFLFRIVTFSSDGVESPLSLGAFWSLSTEWHFYLAVPLVFLVFASVRHLNKMWVLAIVTIAVLVVGTTIRLVIWNQHGGDLSIWNPFVYTPVYGNFDVFLLGFLANWWLSIVPDRARSIARRGWAPLLLVVYVVYSWFSYGTWVGDDGGPFETLAESLPFDGIFAILLPGLVALAMIAILVGAEESNAAWARKPDSRFKRTISFVLYWAGALTFPVYLTHSSIMFSIEAGFHRFDIPVRILIAAVVTILLSLMLHLTIERTALRWRISALKGSTPANADQRHEASKSGPVELTRPSTKE
jgi:peptidoglycan/LPS O-acetylase OafA/YrhL